MRRAWGDFRSPLLHQRRLLGFDFLGGNHRGGRGVIAFIEAQQAHALRRPPGFPNAAAIHADGLALLADGHDFGGFAHGQNRHHRPVAFAGLDVDDAAAAARLQPVLAEGGALAVAVGGDRENQLLVVARQLHAHDLVAFRQRHAAHAARRPAHRPHVFLGEADAFALPRRQEDLPRPIAQTGVDQLVAVLHAHGDDAGRARVREFLHRRLFDHALAAHHHDVFALALEILHRQHGLDLFAFLNRHQAVHRPSLGVGRGVGDLIDLQPIDAAAVGEGEGHRLFLDEIFELNLIDLILQLRAPRILVAAVLLAHFLQLVGDHAAQLLVAGQNRFEFGDAGADLLELVEQLLPLHRGEPVQLQIQDRLRLLLAELEARHQAVARLARRGRGADELDHRVEVVERDLVAFEDMFALARARQIVGGAAAHHVHAMLEKAVQRLHQPHLARLVVGHRQQDHAEAGLQVGVLVKLVENDLGLLAPPQFQHDAHAVAVALVADVGDALDLLLLHQLGDALDQLGLVDLIGNLGDDDGAAILADALHAGLGAKDEGAAPALISLDDARLAVQNAAGGKIGPLDVFHQVGELGLRIVQ